MPDVCEPCHVTSQGLSWFPGEQKLHGLLKERSRRGDRARHVVMTGHTPTAMLAVFHLFLAFTLCISSLFLDFRGIDKHVTHAATSESHICIRHLHVHQLLLLTVLSSRETVCLACSVPSLQGYPSADIIAFPPNSSLDILSSPWPFLFWIFFFFSFLPENVHKYRCWAAFRATQMHICTDMSTCHH